MPYWRLFYHCIWATKNRLPLITEAVATNLYSAIIAKGNDLGAIVHTVGGIEDHVHLAVSIPPGVAPAQFIGQVKGNSSHYMNHVVRLESEFKWQEEYGVVSFGERNLPMVVEYIRNQKEHHRRSTTLAYLEDVS